MDAIWIRLNQPRRRRRLNNRPLSLFTTMANNYRHRFDFDIGYLVKSPCRECVDHDRFPDCMETCLPLNRIHTVLANSVCCSRSYSSMEAHAIFLESREEK